MREVLDKIQEAEKQCPWDEISRGHFVYHWAKELKRSNYFKVCLPIVCGGQDLDLFSFMEITRRLSFIDGNLGWRFQIANGATYFFKNFPKESAVNLFRINELLISGSGSNSGTGSKVTDGYKVSGCWEYCSGSDLATHVSFVFSDDQTGTSFAAIVPRSKTISFCAHNFTGMQHTATSQLNLEQIFVSHENCFHVEEIINNIPVPAFDYEFNVFARAFFIPVVIGLYERYLQELNSHLSFKGLSCNQTIIEESSELIKVYETILLLLRNKKYIEFNALVIEFNERIKQNIISSFHFSGMHGLKKDSGINYQFQNLIAATQHSLLNFQP